jgi:PAS domain S-box-containing protein
LENQESFHFPSGSYIELDQSVYSKPFAAFNPSILLALAGLYGISLYSFLLFHTLAEFLSILVAFSIFTISWNARHLLNGSYMVLLGIAYLCVGSLDILHTLSFRGMRIFTAYDTNLPTQFWIAARYLESLSLLAVPLFVKKKLNPERTLVLYLILSLILIASIFARVFPRCYIEGAGLTPFKIVSEFVICGILILAVFFMVRQRNAFEPSVFKLLIASILVTVATELSFVSYINVYGYEHIIGHLLKVLSFYLIYRAIVVTSIVNPYNSLFWDLNQTKERLRLFIEHAPAALAMFDRDMKYLSVSRRWRIDYNLGDRDLIGISHYEVFPELPDYWKIIHRRGLAGEVIREEEDRFPRADGAIQWVRWEVRPWRDASGTVAGIVIFTEDITERKKIEEELGRYRDELEERIRERTVELQATVTRLEQLNQELQDFAFIASHDLQEPLRKIETFGEILTKVCAPSLDEKGRDYLARIVRSAGRMRQLLQDLLSLSRVATRTESFREVALQETAREAAEVFDLQLKETRASIAIDSLPVIEGDAGQIRQLFQNLIGNALKFRNERIPLIQISGKIVDRKFCEIFIKDNGIGFEPKYGQQIFKPFERLHGRSEYEGTGMGLAICRKIVERHGGAIRAEGHPGQGATFIVKLPVKQIRTEGKS